MSDTLMTETGGSPATPQSIEKRGCALCGLPVGRSGVRQAVGERSLDFCCPGCSAVFQILFNSPGGTFLRTFRETELFRACVEAGVVPRDEKALLQRENRDVESAEEGGQLSVSDGVEHAQDLLLHVEGMWCPACAWLIEDVLRQDERDS